MAVNSVLAPFPTFFDAAGLALENGYIYIGQPGFEARTTPKASFFDVGLTIPTGTASGAAIRTKGGFPINNSNAPAMFYVDGDFSISICDRNGVLLYSAISATLALNVGGAVGPILAPDGNLAATGFGFVNETNTGFVRSGAGIMQTVVGGVLVAQQAPTGTVFQQPVSGSGFNTGVLAVAQPVDADLTAIAALSGTGILAHTGAGTYAERTITSADSSVTITNPGGIAGNIDLSVAAGGVSAATAANSGTTVDITGIPANATRVWILFSAVSLSGTDDLLVQIGDSGGIENTGYVSGSREAANISTAGFIVFMGNATRAAHGIMTLIKGAGNQWFSEHDVYTPTICSGGGGTKTLGDTLDRIRLTRTGTDTLDGSGTITVRWA